MVPKLGFDGVGCIAKKERSRRRSGEFSCGWMIWGNMFKALAVRR